jgi:hypothetical protein
LHFTILIPFSTVNLTFPGKIARPNLFVIPPDLTPSTPAVALPAKTPIIARISTGF